MVNHAIPAAIPRSLHPQLLLIRADQIGDKITQKDAVKQVFDVMCAHHFENNPRDLSNAERRQASFNGEIASLTRQVASSWGLYWLPRISVLGTDKAFRPELTNHDVLSAVHDKILQWEARGIAAQEKAAALNAVRLRRGRVPQVEDHSKVREAAQSIGGSWRENPEQVCQKLHALSAVFPKQLLDQGYKSWMEIGKAFKAGKIERRVSETFYKYMDYRVKLYPRRQQRRAAKKSGDLSNA